MESHDYTFSSKEDQLIDEMDLYGLKDSKVPPLSFSSFMDYDFRQIPPNHRRSNSDHRPETQATMRQSLSWTEHLDSNLELFLPSSLIEEITVDQPSITPPTMQRFEQIFSEKGYDEARIYFNEILAQEKDPKEKGKLLRTAAETAKRFSEINTALDLYEEATSYDPTTAASWIDRAKLLNEQGDYLEAEKILRIGTQKVSHCEQIVKKLIKSYEHTNNIYAARKFLGSALYSQPFNQEFILVEGALFELRQGNVDFALKILNDVRNKSGWKANVYSELVLFFEKSGMTESTFAIVEEGARLNPRNAIVCQALLKHQKNPLNAITILRESALTKWTAEFTDKMTTTVCELLACRNQIREMRLLLSESVVLCSSKQRYKLLLTAAVNELTHGDQAMAPLLFNYALEVSPFKAKPLVSLLIAKMFELNGDYDKADDLFNECIKNYSAEWRVYLEYAQFNVHRNQIQKAIDVLVQALKEHPGSGRLWAFRVQLEAYNGIQSQIQVLKTSIQNVPKSGEVWCEAARIAMNPLSEYFSTEAARQYLEFAYRFTPQHGDTLVELLRVELLEKGLCADLSAIRQRFICSEGNYGQLFLFVRGIDDRPMGEIFESAVHEVQADLIENAKIYQRAIARTSFVVSSVAEEEQKMKEQQSKMSLATFAFGLAKMSRLMTDPMKCKSTQQLLSIVIGTSACIQ